MMKQKFWKQLKSRLCPRQQWRKDQETTKCQCCGKQFRVYRRKHHCRFCGKIFCSHCSDLYINGYYLGLTEKYLRHCQFCKEEIQKIKQDMNQLTYMFEQEQDMVRSIGDVVQNEQSSDDESQFFLIRHVFGSIQRDQMEKITQELDTEAKNLCRTILKRMIQTGKISQQFEDGKLLQILTKIQSELKLKLLPQDLEIDENYMDVSDYISIHLVTGESGQLIEVVNGMVLEKSISIKGMDSYLVHPQVIIVQNSIDQSAVRLKFQELIENDKEVYEMLQRKIMRLNPDIIFVEKNVSRQMLRYFNNQKICVVNGIQKDQLKKIAGLVGIKSTIKNILTTERYEKERFIGELSCMRTLMKPGYKESLIYLQKDVGILSLVMSDKEQNHQSLRKNVTALMKYIRQVHLEKYLIVVDADVWQEKTCVQRGRLYKHNLQYKRLIQKLKPFNLVFYKVEFKQLKWSSLEKKQQEYCRLMNKDYLLEVCGEGSWHQLQPYSEKDITIGHYLLIMATYLLKKCQTCMQMHRQRYYFKDKGVQISGSRIQDQYLKESNILNEKDLTMENMHKYKKKYRQNSNIFTYFKCEICGEVVTRKAKVGLNYLKNSFHYFLMLISHTTNIPNPGQVMTPIRKKANLNIETELDLGQCKHNNIERYLETFNMELRLSVFSLSTYNIDRIDLTTPESKKVIEKKTIDFIYDLFRKMTNDRTNCLNIVIAWLLTTVGTLQQLKLTTNEIKNIQKLERFKRTYKIMEDIQIKLKQVSEKQLSKEIKMNTDWTFFLRQIAKIDSVTKCVIQMLIKFESKIKKKIVRYDTQLSVKTEEPLDHTTHSHEQLIIDTFFTDKIWKKKSQDPSESSQKGIEEQSKFQRNSRQLSDDLDLGAISMPRRTSGTEAVFNAKKVDNNSILKVFMDEMKKRRYQLRRGACVYFSYLNLKDHVSVLAFILASHEFAEQVERNTNGATLSVNIIVSKDISTNWDLKKQIQILKQKQLALNEEQSERESYELITYFHRDFESIRGKDGISFDNYVRSLTSAETWEDIEGGKSRASFSKSSDTMLVVKTIKDEQFQQFKNFALEYISHLQDLEAQGRTSTLAKVYGLYELTIKGMSYKSIVMQNLFFNMEESNVTVYDLKGSWINRLKMPDSENTSKFTGLDTNFKIDKNHQPYILSEQQYKALYGSMEEDINFLSKKEVIDYSLLVIEDEKLVRVAVIDFMRPYHFKQMVEKKFKEIKYGQEPTVLPPQQYANRFMTAFKKYFMPKVCELPNS